jgi:hypothetical protein
VRRLVPAVLALVLLVAVSVVVGRWEARRHAAEENRGIARVRAAVGPLESRSLSAYRRAPIFDCLLYRRGAHPYALELCFDRDGRIVEAIDRTGREPRIWSLREDPSRATLREDPRAVESLIERMEDQ